MQRRAHWENIYRGKTDAELSWHQPQPQLSLSLIAALHPRPRRIIDIGGGQSALAGILLEQPAVHVTVLDISAAALQRAQTRLGQAASLVRWLNADVLTADNVGPVDLWHDRAVFHFLTTPEERRQYVTAAAAAVLPGGHAIVATFAPTGPEKCSGLPVRRFDAPTLAAEFAPQFQLAAGASETHIAPWGATQDFTYVVLQRSVDGDQSA